MKALWKYLLPITTAFFASCSDNDSSNTAGGATEGTNGIAEVDTLYIVDTLSTVDTIAKVDTISKIDTVAKVDTVTKIDTIPKVDTVVVIDTVTPADTFTIRAKNIQGVIQKGPFIKGAPVTVLELDGSALYQTGRAFRGKTGENGSFSVNNLNLVSNYAILEASGYYWNENTGKQSTAPITLNAIADLSNRETVNINLLTQLEYERVQLLVEKEKLSVSDAKKQARLEILKAFHSGEEKVNLEDMNIFGTETGDALLLAVSVMILADNSEAALTELLYNIATDLQDDGEFDNDSIRVNIADKAAFKLNLSQIRKNILNWEMSKDLPDFEDYIERFWINEYKLGACNSDNEGAVKKNGNQLSHYSTTQFLCNGEKWQAIYYNPNYAYGSIVDERDGQTYRTTKIGDQVWMAENMKYIPKGANEKTSCYDDNEANCQKYGRLYDLNAALVSCPEGFHIPSEAEWKVLADFMGGDSIAAPKLRAVGGWDVHDHKSTINDKDEYGFSALPAGVYYFGGFGSIGYYWTDHVVYNKDGVLLGAYNVAIGAGKDMGFGGNGVTTTKTSLRCIKDSEAD